MGLYKITCNANANKGFISYNVGKTANGKDFETYLGKDEFEDTVAGPFDDFLHECFSTYMTRTL